MAVYGIAPIIWTPLSDYFGRRAILIVKLLIFVGANIGLLFAGSFLALILLRVAQALGGAHLACIGSFPFSRFCVNCLMLVPGVAVIGDISTGEERSALLSIFGPRS